MGPGLSVPTCGLFGVLGDMPQLQASESFPRVRPHSVVMAEGEGGSVQ